MFTMKFRDGLVWFRCGSRARAQLSGCSLNNGNLAHWWCSTENVFYKLCTVLGKLGKQNKQQLFSRAMTYFHTPQLWTLTSSPQFIRVRTFSFNSWLVFPFHLCHFLFLFNVFMIPLFFFFCPYLCCSLQPAVGTAAYQGEDISESCHLEAIQCCRLNFRYF